MIVLQLSVLVNVKTSRFDGERQRTRTPFTRLECSRSLDRATVRIETRIGGILEVTDQARDQGYQCELHHAKAFAFGPEEEHLKHQQRERVFSTREEACLHA